MEQRRIKVRLTKDSPYEEYGYYRRGDTGYVDGYSNGNAIVVLEDGSFCKVDLRWIEVVNEECNNINTELNESENEKIRKEIIATIHLYYGEPLENEAKEMIAWLEKQGGHAKFCDSIQVGDKVTRNQDGVLVNLSQLKRVAKPADKQGEQKPVDKIQLGKKYKCITSPRYSMFRIGEIYKPEDKFLCSLMNFCSDCFKPIEDEQKPTWSEEDEDNLKDAIWAVREIYTKGCGEEELVKWLKSIKDRVQPQNRWKPSDEQMEALDDFIYAKYPNIEKHGAVVKSLYQDLKKLKEK